MTGETHQKVNRIVIVITIIILFSLVMVYQFDLIITKLIIFGLFLGYVFGSDLDQESITINEYELPVLFFNTIKLLKIRWLTEIAFYIKDALIKVNKIIWYPYASIFTHRSKFTHKPPLCTMLRYGYLNILYSILIQIPSYSISLGLIKTHLYTIFVTQLLDTTIFILIGYTIIDTTHYILDKISDKRTKTRRLQKKKQVVKVQSKIKI